MKTLKTLFLIGVTLAVQATDSLGASKLTEKKLELNGSSWDVVLVRDGELKNNISDDIFIFRNGQFGSKDLVKRGYTDTYFTISPPADSSDPAVWETMQTGKEGVVFLHGEWVKDKMWGTITEQSEDGRKIVDYTFITRKHWQPDASKAMKTREVTKAVTIRPESPAKILTPVFKPSPDTSKKVLRQMSVEEVSSGGSGGENNFLEEIRKFERAQAQAISPAH